MTALTAAVTRSLYGAYRLARLDPDGLTYFDTTPAGFWFSFFAAVLTFPIYVLIITTSWIDADNDVFIPRIIVVEMISFVIAWTAFPVILPLVLRALNREQHYILGVVAYNWASVLQNLIYLPVVVLGLLGAGDGGPIGMIVLLAILLYSGYVAKVALDIRPLAAGAIVVLDIVISLVLNAWSNSLITGELFSPGI